MNKLSLILLTTAALSVVIWAELDLTQICFDKRLNDVVTHPNDCRGYILCALEPSVHYCQMGLHFDLKRLTCDFPENVNCQLSSQTIENKNDSTKSAYASLMALDVRTGQIIDPLTAYDPNQIVCRHFGAYFLPNPKQCRSYYLCAYGHMHEHSCGPATLWNYTTQQCVPSHKAVCYHLADDEVKEVNETLSELVNSNSVICYPVSATTTTTEAYNTTSVNSTKITTTKSTPSPPLNTITQVFTTTSLKIPTLSSPYRIACPARRQSYLAHPKDCSKYFMCIMGTPVLTTCPKGLLWDSKREYCDSSKNVKCVLQKNG